MHLFNHSKAIYYVNIILNPDPDRNLSRPRIPSFTLFISIPSQITLIKKKQCFVFIQHHCYFFFNAKSGGGEGEAIPVSTRLDGGPLRQRPDSLIPPGYPRASRATPPKQVKPVRKVKPVVIPDEKKPNIVHQWGAEIRNVDKAPNSLFALSSAESTRVLTGLLGPDFIRTGS